MGIGYEKENLPHNNVYTRIQRSNKDGIGVFAICDIPEGTNIFSNDENSIRWIKKKKIGKVNPEIKRLYNDFCIIKKGKYGCPKNFNMLTVGWYLNESKDNPNVKCNKKYDFIALRDIKEGDELTVDYSTYSEHPKNS